MSKVPRLSKVTEPVDRARRRRRRSTRASSSKSLPHRPGVYRMFDAAGEALYVGKARDLKKRVSSYFQKAGARDAHRGDGRAGRARGDDGHALRGRGAAAREQLHQGARAALQHPLPRRQELSVRLPHRRRRFRSCASIAARSTGATATSARFRARARCATASRTLQKVFQLRTCENTVFANRSRPCMLHQIQRCTRALRRAASPKPSTARTSKARRCSCSGKTDEVLDAAAGADGSRRRPSSSSSARRASATRSARLQQLQSRQFVESATAGDIDVVAAAVGARPVRRQRRDDPRRPPCRRSHVLSAPRRAAAVDGEAEIVPAFLDAALRRASGAADDRRARRRTITRRWRRCCRRRRGRRSRSSAIPAASAACGSRWRMQNATFAIRQKLAQKATQEDRLAALQEALGLPSTAQRIECFDVSHTMGERGGRVVRDLRPARDAVVGVPALQRHAARRAATTTRRCARR